MVLYRATDNCNNTSECSFEITVNVDLSAEVAVTDASCGAEDGSISVQVSGGTPPYTIEPNILTGLAAGNYQVIVTDAGGCNYVETVTVVQANNNLEANISVLDVSCFEGNDGSALLEISGGSGNYSAEVSGNANLQALSAGEYFITITDSSTGCELILDFMVDQPDALFVDLSNPITDDCTGQLLEVNIITTGGTAPYTIEALDQTNGVLYVVTDANECTLEAFLELDIIVNVLQISNAVITNSDAGLNNGIVDIEINGGIPPYTFSWIDPNGNVISTNEDLTNVGPGDYIVLVLDANGCVVESQTYTVDEISATIDLDGDNQKLLLYPNPVVENISIEYVGKVANGLSVFDKHGRLIYHTTQQNPKQKINMGHFASGLYIVKADFGEEIVVKTILKI
jgi:hypothetical protein